MSSIIFRGNTSKLNLILFASCTVLALTGGQDKLINAFEVKVASDGGSVASSSPDFTLIGHEDNVSALDVGPGGSYILSGSWDKTARVWKNWECVAVLGGHLQAVWAVLAVDEDRVITASADKIIRLWSISQPKEPIAIFAGHGDAVRGLRLLPGGTSFASCSNDGTVNVYSLASSSAQNQPTRTFSGHTSFVYSLTVLPNGQLASSGEDRSIRVWQEGGQIAQTITIPAISVWAVAALDDGDLVCGSSDAFLRVFTRQTDRVADADEIEAYERTIASQALNKTQVGDIRKDQVPGKEALNQPGTKEGQTKMVSNGRVIEAYQWSLASQQWNKVGEVVGGVGSGQKKLFEGKEYDYVFDVDIADDAPPLKLPYNLSENAYAAAQRFLERNELPMSYMEQVVQFIDKNTEAVNIGNAPTSYEDPYHSGRYIPGQGSVNASQAPPPSSAKSATLSLLPVNETQSFKQANLKALQSKLQELAQNQASSVDASATIAQLTTALQTGKADRTVDLTFLREALSGWPAASRFPLLDLARVGALFPNTSSPSELVSLVLSGSEWTAAWPAAGTPEAKTRETNTFLAGRALSNLLHSADAQSTLSAVAPLLRAEGSSNFAHFSKNGRIAYATVLFNISALLASGKATSSGSTSSSLSPALLESINRVLTEEESDEEVVYRSLIALGNVLVAPSAKSSLPVGNVQLAQDAAEAWGQRLAGSQRVQQVLGDIKIAAQAM